MNQYRIFVISFIVSIIASVAVFAAYFYGIMKVMRLATHSQGHLEDPFQLFSLIFSPVMIVSIVVLGITGLLYRILGIMFVAKNTKLQGGEQALWIIGFIMFGFITAIVFMVMRNSRDLIAAPESNLYKEVSP